ncbi:acetylxylan esterase [Microlunatus speluncae]|uniref:acetylxylan esterase n=1 Tax=Microlunatus speluncae TaxID=2594267 RepID=UPI0012667091|nr:acetylxylan esterase [Microlunatus speluncae]
MPLFDLPLDQLREFRPVRDEPADFDAFWSATLADNAGPLNVITRPEPAPFAGLTVHDVSFAGYGGDPIRGWWLRPERPRGRTACVLHFPGYDSGRGYPHQWLDYAALGVSVLVMDIRGQGGGSQHPGDTADPGPRGASGMGKGEVPGFLTRGIEDRELYYLRRLYVDAYRSVDVARELVGAAAEIVIAAGSQGGGIGLAVAGLRSDLALALLDVPSFALFRRATEISGAGSRAEIARYLSGHRDSIDRVFGTLAYFDGVNFAARAGVEAGFSVALMDQVCPPSTVFAAYHHYAGPKDIAVWPYNGHEGGGPQQHAANLTRTAAFLDG